MNNEYINPSNIYSDQPQPEPVRKLASTVGVLGAISILTCFVLPVVIPAITGGMAIILACLSRAKHQRMLPSARRGVMLAVIGLCINGAVCGYSAAAAYRIYNDPAAMQQFREQLKDNYGIDADELFYDPWAESSGGKL